jgi:hypothetical protein
VVTLIHVFSLGSQHLTPLAILDNSAKTEYFGFIEAWWLQSYRRTHTHDTGRFSCCDLVFRDLSATAVTGDLLTTVTQEPLVSCDAAFSCLLKLGGRNVGSEVQAVQFRNVVNGETLPVSRLIELAADLGLKAEHVRLDWQRLQSLGFNHPLLVPLKNTNVILLTGGGRDGISEVAVWDPGNPYGEILFVPREHFERASTGHALIITLQPSNGAATSLSSDFCWFTSAGIELLAKTSARGKNLKRLVQGREEEGANLELPTRQTDRAIAPTTRVEFADADVKLANKQLPLGPAVDIQQSGSALSRSVLKRRLSPLVRFCIAVGVILAVAGSATFLLKSSATDAVADAIAFAKDVWAGAPNGALSDDRRVEGVSRTGSAPIPAVPPATLAEPKIEAPAASRGERTIPRVERTTRRLAAQPVPLSPDPDVAAAPAISAVVPEAAAAPAIPAVVPEAAAAPAIPAAAPEAAAAPAIPAAAPEAAAAPAIPAAASSAALRPDLGVAAAAPDVRQAASPARTVSSRLSAEEMATLLARGDSLLSVGDVASARLFYERVADAGGGPAAIRLGETFDQFFLDRVHLRSVRGDRDAALFWYRRARDLGATDAEMLMRALETK